MCKNAVHYRCDFGILLTERNFFMIYEIKGTPFPAVICRLEGGESVFCRSGAMSWSSPNVMMVSNNIRDLSRLISRSIVCESFFLNEYTVTGGMGNIAFSSGIPGNIIPLEITPSRQTAVYRPSFLASSENVNIGIFFRKRSGCGQLSGEGFVMQKCSGEGTVFIRTHGSVIEYDLARKQSIIIGIGHLLAMDTTCTMDIETVNDSDTEFLGGEIPLNIRLGGPGHIWLQTMPMCDFADNIRPYIVPDN